MHKGVWCRHEERQARDDPTGGDPDHEREPTSSPLGQAHDDDSGDGEHRPDLDVAGETESHGAQKHAPPRRELGAFEDQERTQQTKEDEIGLELDGPLVRDRKGPQREGERGGAGGHPTEGTKDQPGEHGVEGHDDHRDAPGDLQGGVGAQPTPDQGHGGHEEDEARAGGAG